MKKVALLAMIALGAAGFYSCDQLGFEFDQSFTKSFDVNIKENQSGSGDFTTIQTISINEGELKENLDKIDEITIKSIKINFSDYQGKQDAKVNGTLKFSQILPDIYTLPELNISSLSANNEAFVVYDEAGTNFPGDDDFPANDFINGLINFLKTLPADQLNFEYTANSTDYPLDFKAILEIDAFVKVNPTK